jgi:hypothetical protein
MSTMSSLTPSFCLTKNLVRQACNSWREVSVSSCDKIRLDLTDREGVKMRIKVATFLFLVSLLVLYGCGSEGELKGEVFIVTEGRANIKLALVEITAIPEEEILAYIKNKEAAIRAVEETEKRKYDYQQQLEFYFGDLPHGIAKATSDSEGKFSMKIPSKGRVALAARTSRQLLDDKEEYYWLVWTSLGVSDSKNIILSNNNLATKSSSDSVLNGLIRPY